MALAPGSWVSLFGRNLIDEISLAESTPLPTVLEGRTITITDAEGMPHDAHLQFVAPGQANFLIPDETAVGSATLTFEAAGGSESIPVEIAPVAPGLFSANADGQGVAAGFVLKVDNNGNQDTHPLFEFNEELGRIVFRSFVVNPGFDEAFLLLFGTGIRGVSDLADVSATVNGVDVPVIFAGPQGEFPGLDQVNIGPLPAVLKETPGELDVQVTGAGVQANVVQIGLF